MHDFSHDTVQFLEEFTSSGLPGYAVVDSFNHYKPGEREEYSNVGAALAAYIADLANGASINDLVRRNIFDPLGMVNSGYTSEDFDSFPFSSRGYVNLDGEVSLLPEFAYPTFADGALRSSANDLGRFLAALANGGRLDRARILSNASVERLFLDKAGGEQPHKPIFWDAYNSLVFQDGGDPGVETYLLLHRETGLGVVVLINTTVITDDGQVGEEIVGQLLDTGLTALGVPSPFSGSVTPELEYYQQGQGRPAVVFEAGLGDGMGTWAPVIETIADTTHAFAYSRAGYDDSESSSNPRTGNHIIEELRHTLTEAGVEPPCG